MTGVEWVCKYHNVFCFSAAVKFDIFAYFSFCDQICSQVAAGGLTGLIKQWVLEKNQETESTFCTNVNNYNNISVSVWTVQSTVSQNIISSVSALSSSLVPGRSEVVGGRKPSQPCLQWSVRALSVGPSQVQLKRVILHCDIWAGSEGAGRSGGAAPWVGLPRAQGDGGKLARATVTPGRAHSSLRSPATPAEARTQEVAHSQTMGTRMVPDQRMPTIVKGVLHFSLKTTDVSTRKYYPHHVVIIGILGFSIHLTVGIQFNDIN